MGWFAHGLFAMALLAPLTGTIPANAQQSAAKVNVGSATGFRATPVEISVILFGNEPAGIGSLALQIHFPSALLTYVDAEPGLATLLAEAEVQTGMIEGDGDPDVSVLEMTVSGGTALRAGTLGALKFRIAPDAPIGPILLKSQMATARTVEGEPLQLSQGEDGVVTVMEDQVNNPHLTCFFFSH